MEVIFWIVEYNFLEVYNVVLNKGDNVLKYLVFIFVMSLLIFWYFIWCVDLIVFGDDNGGVLIIVRRSFYILMLFVF